MLISTSQKVVHFDVNAILSKRFRLVPLKLIDSPISFCRHVFLTLSYVVLGSRSVSLSVAFARSLCLSLAEASRWWPTPSDLSQDRG